ncbi:GNAT family N-acetyltransferase [Pelagibius marinus]|uniref:GNAT family N-acetyltransferase n=1 Tax=Pelagibius marinus TaxID=2762760 RepID=UPI001872E45A|nr:GNAT family N-acetyltransferase [Pelagibius marinus]
MTEAGVSCRLASACDHEAVAGLFHEDGRHYWGDATPDRESMGAYVREQVLAGHANVEILLAEARDKAVGFASFAVVHPAPDLGGQLFMKDLFVTEAARSQGVGEILLRALAKIAVERGCVRLDWTAEDYNSRALDFYDRLGARRLTEKIYFRFDGAALKEFAARKE